MAIPKPLTLPPLMDDAQSRNPRQPVLTVVGADGQRPDVDATWTQALLALAERQDRGAFAQLFTHFAPRIKRYLMHSGSPDGQAEELAQEAMATVWRKAALFDPAQAAASTWIFTIARNLRTDALRRRRGEEVGDDGFDFDLLESPQPALDDDLHAARQGEQLRNAMDRLPLEQAQVLRLSYYEDEPHARIAAQLGIPLGTVKSRMRLGVAQLRRLLE